MRESTGGVKYATILRSRRRGAHHKIAGNSNNLARSESIRRLLQKMVEEVNVRVSTSESIKKFAIVERDFEIEKDEVTPTGKLKREVVTAHHRDLIESLYL